MVYIGEGQNELTVGHLKQRSGMHELAEFTNALRREIRLPSVAANRPRPEYLRRGMELRWR
jgi:hypothetical protein